MKNKIVVVFFVSLFLLIPGNISVAQTIEKNDEKIIFEVIPSDVPITFEGLTSNPTVVITEPEDGDVIHVPYLDVIGYATDSKGLDYVQFKWESAHGIYTNESNLSVANYYYFHFGLYYIAEGWHKVTVTFCNIEDNCSSDSVNITYIKSTPPTKPVRPNGPDKGIIGAQYNYTTNSTDVDGDKIKYGWDWNGDNTIDEWTSFYPSGQVIKLSHIWSLPGTYYVKVKAEDEKGAQSDFSSSLTVVITDNHAPDQPKKPSGPSNGLPYISYSYSSRTEDPDGDRIYYMFDWDDGTDSGWIGPYNSGDNVSASHIWSNRGTYQIKVKAKDDPNGDGDLSDGQESIWSQSLPIIMPKSKTVLGNIFEKMPILKQIFSFFFKK
jgi:hypothetical protein